MTDIIALLSDPLAATVLGVILVALIIWQRGIPTRAVPGAFWLKQRLVRVAAPAAKKRGLTIMREKDDSEFIRPTRLSPEQVMRRIRPQFQPALVSNAKYRMTDGQRQWCHSQWAARYDADDNGDGKLEPRRTHVYLFADGIGGTDVYAHVEDGIATPYEHLTDPMTKGDADGKFAEAFEV